MKFLEKLKVNLFEQISFVGIVCVLFITYLLLDIKIINILIIPGIITFITYKLVKSKLLLRKYKKQEKD